MNKIAFLSILMACIFCSCTSFVEEANKGLATSSQSLEDAASSLSKGLSDLDPIGLNKLIAENDKLKNVLSDLESQLFGLSSKSGLIELGGKSIVIEISDYVGTFRVNGFVNSEENWFWKEKLFSNNEIDYFLDEVNFYNALDAVLGSSDKKKLTIDNRSEARTTSVVKLKNFFKNALNNRSVYALPQSNTIDLEAQLEGTGPKKINLFIMPIEGNKNKYWSIKGKLKLVSTDRKTESIIKEFNYDSRLYPKIDFGEDLEPVEVYINVK